MGESGDRNRAVDSSVCVVETVRGFRVIVGAYTVIGEVEPVGSMWRIKGADELFSTSTDALNHIKGHVRTGHGRGWTDEEVRAITDGQRVHDVQLSHELNRTVTAIRNKRLYVLRKDRALSAQLSSHYRRADVLKFKEEAQRHGVRVTAPARDNRAQDRRVVEANGHRVRISVLDRPTVCVRGSAWYFYYRQVRDGALNAVWCGGKVGAWFIVPFLPHLKRDKVFIPERERVTMDASVTVWSFKERWDLLC